MTSTPILQYCMLYGGSYLKIVIIYDVQLSYKSTVLMSSNSFHSCRCIDDIKFAFPGRVCVLLLGLLTAAGDGRHRHSQYLDRESL